MPGLDQPAASRYAATTPTLLRWFDPYNESFDQADRVRPFNFLTLFPARRRRAADWDEVSHSAQSRKLRKPTADVPRPVAPYNHLPAKAAEHCFDRLTGALVSADRLKTYAEALSDYHLHPEAKFLNGDYLDRGLTERRHVGVVGVQYIGKEANRWEEQFHLGYDPEAQIEYDGGPKLFEQVRARIAKAAAQFGQRALSRQSGVAREQMRALISGKASPRKTTIVKLLSRSSE